MIYTHSYGRVRRCGSVWNCQKTNRYVLIKPHIKLCRCLTLFVVADHSFLDYKVKYWQTSADILIIIIEIQKSIDFKI